MGTCKYCDKDAIVKVTPQEGGPVVEVCADHARLARKAVQGAKTGKIVQKREGEEGNPFVKRT